MAEFASLPLFTDAWIADTSHLTRCDRGLYMDLLILCWRSPECRVPNQTAWIARKLGCPENEIEPLQELIAEFMSSTGNWLFQKRLKKEFNYIRAQRELQSDRAKSRWDKEKSICRTHAGNKTRHQSGNAPSPSPSPSKKKEDDGAKAPLSDEASDAAIQSAVELYNAVALNLSLPQCQRLTDRRKRSLRCRLLECGGVEGWVAALEKLTQSAHCQGDNDRGWVADFDFLIQAKSFTKLMEGSYAKRASTNGHQSHHDSWEQAKAILAERDRRESEAQGSGAKDGEANLVVLPGLRQGPG